MGGMPACWHHAHTTMHMPHQQAQRQRQHLHLQQQQQHQWRTRGAHAWGCAALQGTATSPRALRSWWCTGSWALRARHSRRIGALAVKTESTGANLLDWLKEHGAPEQNVVVKTKVSEVVGKPLDVSVAKADLHPGDVALSIPDELVVTLSRIFEDEGLAELLTTGKLSELACLALYLMYEKKIGQRSFWYHYIRELDRQRARGVQAVESPLLWQAAEVEDLLQGSPVVEAVKARLAGVKREYEELDTVWFMAGSLFNRYPFDIPTEAFSFTLFLQAFAAVQASIVHLQGVPLSKRFALVPLGPPLLTYSSTCKAMLAYNKQKNAVELRVDRHYQAGEPLHAWCGPQPNSRLLLNYGIVDEANPYDKRQITVIISNSDPLYQRKRAFVQQHGLSTQQTFDLTRKEPLPPLLLPFMRLAYATNEEQLSQVVFASNAPIIDTAIEQTILCQLISYLEQHIKSYKHPSWKDLEIINSPSATPREKVAARLTKIEKSILQGCLEKVYGLKDSPSLNFNDTIKLSNFTVRLA